jgi:hypothetical protein
MTPVQRVLVAAFGFILIEMPPLGAFAYALLRWRIEARKPGLSMLRKVAAYLGFLGVATQGGLLLSVWIWPQLSRMPLLGDWAGWVFPTFLIAVPFVLAGKGASRWWLLSSSVYLFVVFFFIVLTP